MSKITHFIAAVAVASAATACTDNDPVEPGFAVASATVTDGTAPAGAALSGTDDLDFLATPDGAFSGSFSGSARVELSTDGEKWVELGSPSSVTVELQSEGEESIIGANASIPVGTYSRVRLTLTGGRADIDAGATVGGISLTGAVTITVGGDDGEVVIEKEVQPFTVDVNSHAHLLFDLNTELWVHEESASSETAEDEEVEEAAFASRSVVRTD